MFDQDLVIKTTPTEQWKQRFKKIFSDKENKKIG